MVTTSQIVCNYNQNKFNYNLAIVVTTLQIVCNYNHLPAGYDVSQVVTTLQIVCNYNLLRMAECMVVVVTTLQIVCNYNRPIFCKLVSGFIDSSIDNASTHFCLLSDFYPKPDIFCGPCRIRTYDL
jgi:hypothetical protein